MTDILKLSELTVSIKLGDTELTRTDGAMTIAKVFARWICAALVTEYAYSKNLAPYSRK